MCFSASVSFTTGTLISIVGLLALSKARPRMRLFAALPLLFGIQQLTEGAIWSAMPTAPSGPAIHWLTQAYAFFIGVLWPVLFPLSLYLIEPSQRRRRLILILLALGGVVAIYTLVVMGLFGFSVRVAHQCLVYENPAGIWPGMELVYLLATSGAFFIASDDRIHWLGVANLAGFGIAASFFSLNLPSVWCFCAAIISSLICWYVWSRNPAASTGSSSGP
ncbi:DUF6629 family protein [Devosia sp.]|uniref:DUF6629 family protein n=1 Tax=Devosia sp. TaxID=1871048 RepID=UPI0032671B17